MSYAPRTYYSIGGSAVAVASSAVLARGVEFWNLCRNGVIGRAGFLRIGVDRIASWLVARFFGVTFSRKNIATDWRFPHRVSLIK